MAPAERLRSFRGPCSRLESQLSRSLRGRLHGAHGGGSDAALLQSVEPVDGGSAWGADLRAQLRRMFPGVAQQFASSLQHTAFK